MIPDLPFPNPLPVKLRILKPYDDDFVIDWTDQQTVAASSGRRLICLKNL